MHVLRIIMVDSGSHAPPWEVGLTGRDRWQRARALRFRLPVCLIVCLLACLLARAPVSAVAFPACFCLLALLALPCSRACLLGRPV
mmetsp:Transcript_8175/g.25994  ORF Transcript_8175/g.25994 Transcript_8175/m.25994 type:complete len:86 (+) Transcript_8175:372-629(+)